MFNSSLKKEALMIHNDILEKYNESQKMVNNLCEQLYSIREESVALIKFVQSVINSIANKPKNFSTELGKIGLELAQFHVTEEYGKDAYEETLKAARNVAEGAAAGLGIASMTPTVLMSIATTFGTASTGTAISALSGAAAQKAAIAWIGRTFAAFAVKGSAGMAAGNAFLALAGPIGWGITASSTVISLVSLTIKNKKIADSAVEEAKEIAKIREALEETTEKIKSLKSRNELLLNDINKQRNRIVRFIHLEYQTLSDDDKYFLGALVNNILSLSMLLNETIE